MGEEKEEEEEEKCQYQGNRSNSLFQILTLDDSTKTFSKI